MSTYNKYNRQRSQIKAKSKGNSLESYLLKNIELLSKQFPTQFFGEKLNVRKINGMYAKKEPSDFILNTTKGNWLLEAKECSSDKLQLSKIPEHQKNSLLAYRQIKSYFKGAFVVWFMTGESSNLEIDSINKRIRYIENFENKKYFTVDDGIPFGFDIFL